MISGAILAAGPLALGASEEASFVLGYGAVLLLVAGELYRRRKRDSR